MYINFSVSILRYYYLIMAPTDDTLPEWAHWLRARNETELAAMNPEEVVLILINRGSTQHLFRNPGCAMEFLFEPLPAVRALLEREFATLGRASHLAAQTVHEVISTGGGGGGGGSGSGGLSRRVVVSPRQDSNLRPAGALVISIQVCYKRPHTLSRPFSVHAGLRLG